MAVDNEVEEMVNLFEDLKVSLVVVSDTLPDGSIARGVVDGAFVTSGGIRGMVKRIDKILEKA